MKTIKNRQSGVFFIDGIEEVESTNKKDEYMTKEMMLEYFKEKFKEEGFKKVKQTWYKDDGTIIYMFNVQNSQFGRDLFYFNIGLTLTENGLKIPTYDWDCSARFIYRKTIAETFNEILKWFENYNTLEKIKSKMNIAENKYTDPRWRLDEYFERHP